MGVVAGAPDLLIFDSPPRAVGKRGVALEMKRKTSSGDLRGAQEVWRESLENRGWVHVVGCGAPDAIRQLQEWGY